MGKQSKSISKRIKKVIISLLIAIIIRLIILYLTVTAIIFILYKAGIINLDDMYNDLSSSLDSGSTTATDSTIVQTITGDTYYVSPNGSDSNSGNSEGAPLATISAGIEKLKPGDGLIIKAGTYDGKISISKKGEVGKPVIIRADGEVIFDGKGRGQTLLTVSSQASYVNIEGITFKNLYARETHALYLEPECNNINILNCNFENIKAESPTSEDSAANAIYFDGSGSSRDKAIDNVIIKNCTMKNICAGYSEGISVDGNCTNITIDGVTATAPDVESNIAICICGHDSGTNSNPDVNRPEHIKIMNCNVSDAVSPYGQDSYGIYVDGGYDVTISGNTVSSSTGGIEAGAENYITAFKGRETERIIIQNNTIINCKKAMYIGGYERDLGTSKDITVTGNTFTNCGDIYLGKCKNVTFTDNILNDTGFEYDSDSGPQENVVKQKK